MAALHTTKLLFVCVIVVMSLLCLALILHQDIFLQGMYVFNHFKIQNWTQDLNISSGNLNTTGPGFKHMALSEIHNLNQDFNFSAGIPNTTGPSFTKMTLSEIRNLTQYLNISSGDVHTTDPSFKNITLPDEVVRNVLSTWRTTSSRDNTLTVAFRGRLGNSMFEYASLLGIAVSTGKRPLIPASNQLHRLFNISFIGDIRMKSSTRVSEKQYGAFDRKLLTLPAGNVEIWGYLQSWKYFHSIRAAIRKEFVFRKKYVDLSRQCFEKYTNKHKNRTVIGIHIRRTDMTSGGKRGYVPAPLSYIKKAVEHMKTKFHNPLFLIATDDKNWCKKHVVSSDVILMETSDSFVDFATLTLCDHMIMTVGTFGWWAAWLGDGYAVYYRDFPRPGSELAHGLIKEDHFLPHWVPLDA